jgi:DNA-binding XRE family transcriptional regulator
MFHILSCFIDGQPALFNRKYKQGIHMPTFRERLRKLRISMNLKQKAVGAWIDLRDSSIRNYETENNRTSNPAAIKISTRNF